MTGPLHNFDLKDFNYENKQFYDRGNSILKLMVDQYLQGIQILYILAMFLCL